MTVEYYKITMMGHIFDCNYNFTTEFLNESIALKSKHYDRKRKLYQLYITNSSGLKNEKQSTLYICLLFEIL